MSEGLKACPFCHAPPRLHTNSRGHRYAVCEGVASGHSLLSMQADDWNDSLRTPPAADPRGGSEPDYISDGWLADQLRAWPRRVHQDRTTNINTLMKMAADTIDDLRAKSTPAPAADDGRASREAIARLLAETHRTHSRWSQVVAAGGAKSDRVEITEDEAQVALGVVDWFVMRVAALHATAAAGVGEEG